MTSNWWFSPLFLCAMLLYGWPGVLNYIVNDSLALMLLAVSWAKKLAVGKSWEFGRAKDGRLVDYEVSKRINIEGHKRKAIILYILYINQIKECVFLISLNKILFLSHNFKISTFIKHHPGSMHVSVYTRLCSADFLDFFWGLIYLQFVLFEWAIFTNASVQRKGR